MPRTNTAKPSTPARRTSPRKGMRLYKIWLPDMGSLAFIRHARRDSLAIARSAGQQEDQNFVDSISILPEYRNDRSPQKR